VTTRLVYSVEEAAELLGCSVDHISRLISKGDLKRCDLRASGTHAMTRIRHDHLVAFLDAREIA
jgi:excisionase family DNA binding protein